MAIAFTFTLSLQNIRQIHVLSMENRSPFCLIYYAIVNVKGVSMLQYIVDIFPTHYWHSDMIVAILLYELRCTDTRPNSSPLPELTL